MRQYRIHTVAQLTGLSPALIRAWESRYGMVKPERTPAGYRLYSESDVALLKAAQQLVQRGMAPREIARMPRESLPALSSEAAVEPAAAPSAAPVPLPLPSLPEPATRPQPLSFAERIDQLVKAFEDFDTRRVDELLATPLLSLPPLVACRELLAPLLRELGDRWHRGDLSVAAEHFGTSLVRGKLKALLASVRSHTTAAGKHRVLCACPRGEEHEVGLLLFALDAASQGWEPIYLGANLPAGELGKAVKKTRPSLVAVSVVQRRSPEDLLTLLQQIRRAIGKSCPLLVGGGAITGMTEVVRAAGAVLLPESGRLDDVISAH